MRLAHLFAGFALLTASAAGAAAEVPRADARMLMERLGMFAQFANEAEDLRKSFPETIEGQFAPDLIKPLTDVVVASWDGEGLLEAVEIAYADILTADDLDEINGFIDTPLGERLVEAETASTTNEAWEAMEADRAGLIDGLQKDKERYALFQRIDKALRATDVGATIMVTLIRATIIASAPPEMLGEAEQMAESMRPEIVEENRSYTLASFAQTYRDFSLDELRLFADHLESDAARTMNGAFFAVANDHYLLVGQRIGKGMAEVLRQKRS